MKLKRSAVLFLTLIIFSFIFISCSADKGRESIDLSDIEDMNIGASMPEILYGDDEKIILHGTFGILTFDIDDARVTQRVNTDEFGEITDTMCGYSASKDGRRIFISQFEEQKIYAYNLSSGKLTVFDGDIDEEVFSESIFTDDEEIKLIEALGSTYLTSSTYLKKDSSILFLKAEANWQMKTLQLVEYDMSSNKELKVIDIFK